LIPDHAWELPFVQKVIEVLESIEFLKRLKKLGGYTVENPGSLRAL